MFRSARANFYERLKSSRIEVPTGPAFVDLRPLSCRQSRSGRDKIGHVDCKIRDLDQTIIGNPAHDLIRLGLLLAMAARGSNVPGLRTGRMTEQLARDYREALRSPDEKPKGNSKIVDRIVHLALRPRWKNLANKRPP
jgi:uncharacterized protein (DUF2252 family)